MFTVLFLIIAVGFLLCVAGAASALKAYLGFRRARLLFQRQVIEEVSRLSVRASELEVSATRLSVRAGELPIRVARLQSNISTLQVLSASLALSLRQASRILTFAGLKTASASGLTDALRPLLGRSGRAE